MAETFTFDDVESVSSEENEDLFLDNLLGDETDVLCASDVEVQMAIHDLMHDQRGEFPTVEQWEDEPIPEVVSVTMGRAVHEVWQQAKQEVNCARNGFKKLSGSPRPTIEQHADFYFGPESEIFRAFQDVLQWEHSEFSLFLKTFCVQSAYKVSANELYNKAGYIRRDGLMEEAEYVQKWREIGEAMLPDDEKAAPATSETFWMVLQEAANKLLRRSVIEPWVPADDTKRLDMVKLVFDDNKMWFDARSSTAQLKITQHVRDNRRGPVHHDAVASATGQLAGFRFEKQGDTTMSVVSDMIKEQFVPGQGNAGPMKLDFMEPHGDRAYTVKSLFYSVFVQGGARVTGTKQRSPDFPFCYGMKLKETDARTDVPTGGPKTMFVKSVEVDGRKVYAVAYRNGNGGVILGITTESDLAYSWDVTLKNPADRVWWSDLIKKEIAEVDVLRRCFGPLHAKRKTDVISEELAMLLSEQPIQPLTMGQATDHAWWICRSFDFSSTSSWNGFAVFDGDEQELEHQDAWTTVKAYNSKAGERSWNLGGTQVKNETKSEPAHNDNHAAAANNEDDGDENDSVLTVSKDRLLHDDEYAAQVADSIDPMAEDDGPNFDLDIDIIRSFIVSEGGSLSQATDETRKEINDVDKFIKWCRQHRFLRPLYFRKTVASLRELASRISPPMAIPEEVTTAGAIYKVLSEHLASNVEAGMEESEPSAADFSKPLKLLQGVLSAAFLKKQSGETRAETRRGLDLEKPLARRLLADSASGLTRPFIIHEVESVPLVARTDIANRSAIGSTDFVAMAETPDSVDGSNELIAIEVKARVKPNTAEKQRASTGLAKLRLATSTGLGDSDNKFFVINASDDFFPHFIHSPKEALQILHHAFVYDVAWVLLLIGDNFSRIIAGIFVKFDEPLKIAWGKVLQDMHRLSIGFIYERPGSPFNCSAEQLAVLGQVLPMVKTSGAALDIHSFEQFVKVWRTVRLVWPKPLPPISKLLPLIFAKWNAIKGGSDTITKLIWSAMYSPPNRCIQAHAIARILLLLCIQIHRANQIATSKPNLPYKSLLHFRNANNKRFALHATLIAISHCFDLDTTESTADTSYVSEEEEDALPAPLLQGRATRGSKPTLKVQVNLPVTGDTPKRSVRKTLARLEAGGAKPKRNQSMVMERVKNCTGIPAWSPACRGYCIVCGTDTFWYCLGCHVNVCSNNISDEKKAKAKHTEFDCYEMDITIAALPGSGAATKVIPNVANTCCFHHHRGAIFKTLRASDNS